MGANLSLLAPNAHTVAVRSYVDVLSNFKFLEVVNNTRFLKTIRAFDTSTGTLVVIKIFIKPPQVAIHLHDTTDLLAREAGLLSQYPNLLVYRKIIETDSAGYLVRQMIQTNLYDRLSLRPFLVAAEKRWLVFQMLKTMELLHEHVDICHGDLKTENFFVTSSNWLVLADFSQHTKPVYLPDDNPSEFVFYFDSSNRRACYVAPERFYSKIGPSQPPRDQKKWNLDPTADLFSLGCVIAELYMDGEPPFTLSNLYRYRKGDQEENLSGISDPYVKEMTRNLISLNPQERKSASETLELYRGTFFPGYFYDFLYDFMTHLNTSKNFLVDSKENNVTPSDLRIEKIYSSFDEINHALDFVYSKTVLSKHDSKFPYLKLNLKGMPQNHIICHSVASSSTKSSFEKRQQGALILLDTIFSLVKTVRRPTNKIKACELILALSEHVADETKLDRSLPYLFSFLDEFIDTASSTSNPSQPDPLNFSITPALSSSVASYTLVVVTNLLESCSSINPINAHVFPDFIYPKLKSLVFLNCSFKEELNHVKSSLSTCLPHLTKITERFIMYASAMRGKKNDIESNTEQITGTVNVRCENDVKDITEALLTDPSVNVRTTLLANILPICQFFGVDKTNDIILPHLITYLNDQSFHLRLAFLSSIKSIGNFIGALAFEQYLLPLLIQALGDHEPFIVLKILEIFNHFVKERLINSKSQFNALSIYKELLTTTLPLLLQPIEWIRQSVICLVVSISDNLSNADRFCFLYPLIKTYLSYNISSITWNSLYPCLTRPVSRQIFEMSMTWLSNSAGKTLFWKEIGTSFFRTNGKKRLVTYSKDLGKSIYIQRNLANGMTSGEKKSILDTPLSHTDKQWVYKLKSIGMDDFSLWKISFLRSYLTGLNQSSAYTESKDYQHFKLASTINIAPFNIFCDVKYKTETLAGQKQGKVFDLTLPQNKFDASISDSMTGTLSISHFPNAKAKAKASLQTNEANIFAEMNSTQEEFASKSQQHHHHHHHHHDSSSSNSKSSIHKIISMTEDTIISVGVNHNFEGTNPYVLAYLRAIDFKPSLDDFPEFGPICKEDRANDDHIPQNLVIQGTQVAHVNTNSTCESIQAVTKVVVSPTSEFIITGSESGHLKVWDTFKMETMSTQTAALFLDLASEITYLTFLPHRFAFAVSTKDGLIRILKVHVVRGKTRKIIKYSRMVLIRKFRLEKGFAIGISFTRMGSQELLVTITSTSQIVAFDIITTLKAFEFQNPPQYGVPNSFIASANSSWLLLGTTDGILCFWDMRFGLHLRSWKIVSSHPEALQDEIRHLITVPKALNLKIEEDVERFAMIGGSNQKDVTVWEIPSFECREIYCAHQELPKAINFFLQEVNVSVNPLQNFSSDFQSASSDLNNTLIYADLADHSSDVNKYIVTSTSDNRVLLWNLDGVNKSISLFGSGTHSQDAKYTSSVLDPKLTIHYEKLVTTTSKPVNKAKSTRDAITDLAIVTYPYHMLVTGERDGSIRVYK